MTDMTTRSRGAPPFVARAHGAIDGWILDYLCARARTESKSNETARSFSRDRRRRDRRRVSSIDASLARTRASRRRVDIDDAHAMRRRPR